VVETPAPPQPRVLPRVWDAEDSYQVGWPIRIRVGVLNTGEAIVNAPQGETFGVSVQAWRVEQVEVAPTPPPAAADGGPQAADGGAQPAADGGAQPAADAGAPRLEERREAIECEALAAEAPRGGVEPLATTSSAYRRITLDELCAFERPGRYRVELVVEVPTAEGADVSGAQEPVRLDLDLTLPDPPMVARASIAEDHYEVGQPISATVRLTNFGPTAVRMAVASLLQVQLRAMSAGEEVPCSEPPRGRGRSADLAPGQSLETTVAISERCQLTLPGAYTITPQVVVPAAGPRTFTGTIAAAPIAFELTAPPAPAGGAPAAGDAGPADAEAE
jgi:hypothetical protein